MPNLVALLDGCSIGNVAKLQIISNTIILEIVMASKMSRRDFENSHISAQDTL